MLAGPEIEICAVSRFFSTPCFPAGAGPDYVNAAARIRTSSTAPALLERLHDVEKRFGRERRERWGARTLDIDLLDYDGRICPDPETQARWRDLPPEAQRLQAPTELILPHPRMQERAFVLIPLLDVAPGWIHPVSGRTVRQMVDALPEADKNAVRPL